MRQLRAARRAAEPTSPPLVDLVEAVALPDGRIGLLGACLTAGGTMHAMPCHVAALDGDAAGRLLGQLAALAPATTPPAAGNVVSLQAHLLRRGSR